jgi:hypothetical protein
MSDQKLRDRPGIAWQQLAIGPACHAMVRGLDDLLGGEPLLFRCRGPTDADQPGDLCDLQPRLTMQQEVAH